jgi:hypothetical protein
MRSWFYRVFLVLAVLFLCLFNFVALIEGNFWIMKAVSSNIPYINLLFLNTGQAVIAVFLSSEFLKSDKKLDTSEVFYVHPLSNAEYVAGKIWGNINVFFRLDLFIILIVVIFNLASGVPIDWTSYIAYFFLICIPTLVYIFGLSIGLMLILKNQAITFVLLLGYIALTLFYIEDKFYYLFDYMVYSLPLVKSSIVGFTNWTTLINHRCIYLLIGLGFICISIFLFRRLPNTRYGRYRWLALAICFLTAGGFAAYNHINPILKEAEMRALYTDINNKYVHTSKMVIDNYDITVEQHPETISAEVVMKGVALETSRTFVFCLNPALQLREVREGEKSMSFDRESQIILVDFGREITRGDSISFLMKYDGHIDGGFCYLDIPEEILEQRYSHETMFNIDKKYSFQSKDYILFTPETYWYPRPGTSYSSDSPDWQQAYFSNFRLTVKTLNGLKALSQGTMKWPLVKKREKRNVAGEQPRPNEEQAMVNDGQGAGRSPGQGNMRGGGQRARGQGMRNPGQGAWNGGQGTGRGEGRRPPERARPQGSDGSSAQGAGGNIERGAGRNPEQGNAQGEGQRARGEGQGNPEQSVRNEGQGTGRGEGRRPERVRPQGSDGDSVQSQSGNIERGAGRNPGQGTQGEGRRARGEGQGNPEQSAGGDNRIALHEEGEDRNQERVAQGVEQGKEQAADSFASGGTAKNNAREDLTEKPSDIVKDSLFIFETDFPSPSMTLIIGDYEQKSIDVDDVEYSVWYLKGHDYFSSVLDSITDTIPSQIRERRRSLESTYSLDYSFSRFSLVEVPVQFFSYVRTWTQAQEKMQPEMVLFPEKGCLFWDTDFARRIKNEKQWAKWNGQDINDKEAAVRAFNSFMWVFQRTESNFNFSQERGAVNITAQVNPYFVFPQLYNFRYNIFSSEWPIANRLIEVYLQDKTDNNTWIRQMNGISNSEKANLLMEQYPFKELLSDVEHRDLLDNVISLKANFLFAPAERNIGYEEYRDSLRDVLQQNKFTNQRFEDLLDTMGLIAGENLRTSLEAWNNPARLPVYIVETPEVTQISNRDKEVYVVKLQITNDSDVDGIINVETMVGGGGRNNVYDPRAKRKISIAARETKRLVSVWDEAPRNMIVNTLVSANLPNLINLPVSNIIRERNKPIDEEGDFVVQSASHDIPGEVIVDNEDSLLFVLSAPDIVGLLPKWLDQVDDNSFRYSGVSPWRAPLQWTLTTNDKYYGTHVRSAYVIKSGSGSQTATWKIPVPSTGQYDLFYYVYKPDELRQGRNDRGGRGGDGRGGGGDAEYSFKVKYNGDEDDAYVSLRRSDEGWSILGTYYFNEDTVSVVLTNTCSLRSVTADAVKIVRR